MQHIYDNLKICYDAIRKLTYDNLKIILQHLKSRIYETLMTNLRQS